MAWIPLPETRRRRRNLLRLVVLITVLYFFVPALIPWPSPAPKYPYEPSHLLSKSRPRIQHQFMAPQADAKRLAAVKAEFAHAYTNYRQHAWLHDEVRPLTGHTATTFCGWAATLIDSLDTLYIMGFEAEFEEAVQAVEGMSLRYAPSFPFVCAVNPFEMTIRHLGGLLSAFDVSGGKDARLSRKAVGYGEMMMTALGENRVQCRAILWPLEGWLKSDWLDSVQLLHQWRCEGNGGVSLARMGSQVLEFLRLSLVSGKRKWADHQGWLTEQLERVQMQSRMKGLWPRNFDGHTCEVGICDLNQADGGAQFFTTASGADSSYEYLVKGHLLYGGIDKRYGEMWRKALPTLKEQILFRPQVPGNEDLMFPGEIMAWRDRSAFSGKVEHLSCFLGGLFALSARTVVDDADDLEIAAKLTNGCVWAYESTASGIMPDTVTFEPCPDHNLDCEWNDLSFAAKTRKQGEVTLPTGFIKVDRPEYLLRPEAIESVFYMYRITGDEIWREKGWKMFTAIRAAARARYGHASVANTLINSTEGGNMDNQWDKMESFWMSETLKYFYLLFADPRLLSLDEWVFNTEGHPFRLEETYRGELFG